MEGRRRQRLVFEFLTFVTVDGKLSAREMHVQIMSMHIIIERFQLLVLDYY